MVEVGSGLGCHCVALSSIRCLMTRGDALDNHSANHGLDDGSPIADQAGATYGLTVSPTRNDLPSAGNPLTSEYRRSSAFSTRRRRSAGTHLASEALTPRSSEARSGVSPASTRPSASTNTKGSSMEALHQKSASAVTPWTGPASTEPPARHSGRLASRPPVTRFFPSRCAARPSTQTFDTGANRAEYSSPSIRALPTLSATKKE